MPPRVAPGHAPVRIHPGAERERRCYDHPHRVIQTACARCRTPFCADCLTPVPPAQASGTVVSGDPACRRCREELAHLAVRRAWDRRPWWQRLRPTWQDMRRAAVTSAIIGAIALPIGVIVREIVASPITPEEFARIAFALRGGFGGPEGTNYLNTVLGGTYLGASAPSATGYEPTRLIDTWATARVPAWRTASALPIELTFALPNQTVANRAILRPHPGEARDTWPRAFEVAFSTVGPSGPWTVVLDTDLDPGTVATPTAPGGATPADDRFVVPSFEVRETPVRWVRLVIRSNGGSRDYTSLGEFEVLYAPRTPLGAPPSVVPGRP